MIEIRRIDDARVRMFASLTETQLRKGLGVESPAFIVESPKVIERALDGGWEPLALLCERRHVEGDAAGIVARRPEMPVYVGSRDLLAELTGYVLTRGVLCAMRRRELPSLASVCKDARRLAVIDGVTDTTNIGAIFRSAAALGVDGVILTADACDPLNRRASRVSMGTVFQVPWTVLPPGMGAGELRRYGFKTVAMALTDKSLPIDAPELAAEPRLAIILGTEGDGLREEVIADADYTVRIPMRHGVDSLNVAAAAAVAFYVFC